MLFWLGMGLFSVAEFYGTKDRIISCLGSTMPIFLHNCQISHYSVLSLSQIELLQDWFWGLFGSIYEMLTYIWLNWKLFGNVLIRLVWKYFQTNLSWFWLALSNALQCQQPIKILFGIVENSVHFFEAHLASKMSY